MVLKQDQGLTTQNCRKLPDVLFLPLNALKTSTPTMVPFARVTPSIKIVTKSSKNDSCSRPVVSPDDSDCNVTPPKSANIPITNGLHRTHSEIQLCEDMAIADYRDYCMYTRITAGIQRSQFTSNDIDIIMENDACLANIRKTRSQPPEEAQSLESRHESLLKMLGNPALKTTRDFLNEATSIQDGLIFDEPDEEGVFVMDF